MTLTQKDMIPRPYSVVVRLPGRVFVSVIVVVIAMIMAMVAVTMGVIMTVGMIVVV
jgi:hypothetical protein